KIEPKTPHKVLILTYIALNGVKVGKDDRSSEAYFELYRITKSDAAKIRAENKKLHSTKKKITPDKWITSGIVPLAKTPKQIEKAIAIIRKEIGTYKIQSEEGRALRLALADLYYIKRLQSNAVIEYRNYIRMYGPPLDNDGKVMVQAKTRDDQLRSVYEAGIRIANAWDLQGNKTKMVEAFKWVIENQYYDNNHLAEAWYHVASQMIKGKGNKTKEKKRLMAETLWKEVCNKSMDFDTKKFQTQWVFLRRPKTPPLHIDPTQWIKLSMMKSGKAFTELNEHAIAGEIFLEYVKQFDKLKGQKAREGFKKDKYVNMARYAGGLAFSKIEEYEKMAEIFRPYLKGYRDDKFRGPGLMLLGHYGMKGELYTDSMEAYLTLLDEYGTNKVNKLGKPIAVHRSKHLMGKKSNWNGIKMAIPKNYDVGEIRYSLGFMYWKKEDWSGVVMALTPFYKNITFKKNKSREQAMYMLGQSLINLKKYNEAIDVLTAFIFQYPKFKAIEEVYKDTLMACYKAKQWNKVFSKHKDFSLKFKESAWRTYMDYYKAHAEMATGKKVKARNRFLDIAQAETFEDVKADANYYVADGYLRSKPVNYKKAFPHLEASVTLYPRQASLFDAGRTAIQLKKWGLAKTYLDRCIREYPNNDASMMRKARNLLQVVLQEEAK
ncbi:MAG: tetratricopeptide repeat protein, partial [Lentisphaeria bacterium]|nr:tetratricopeptide repeat protein [Lentisphaeria bacterium]